MKTQELIIDGMSCGHCVMSVKKELGKVPHLIVDDVQIGKARVTFEESKVTHAALVQAIEEAGYRILQVR